MAKIRVLIVDDSVVIRRMLTVYLAADPDIEIVGTASDGKIGLAKIPQVNPDIIILDIEMPVMDGLQTLAAIRKTYLKLPVIMFSTLTEHGASATLDALAMGASDYATKSLEGGTLRQHVSVELIPKIKALCGREPLPVAAAPKSIKTFQSGPVSSVPIELLAIGVSTGGPNALARLLPGLAANFPVPVVIVQHMPQMFNRQAGTSLCRD